MLLLLDTDILPKVRHIGFVTYSTPWIHFPRITDEYILYIVKSGELYINEDEKEYILKEGDFFLLQPYKHHEGFKEACCAYYYIHFKHPKLLETSKSSGELTKEILVKRRLSLTSDLYSENENTNPVSYLPKHYNISNKMLLLEIFNMLRSALDDYLKKYEDYKKIPSCTLLEILIKVCREYVSTEIENIRASFPKTFVTVQHMLDYINKEYQQKITSEDIESIFELNYDYLNRAFHKMTGYSIFNYINVIRISKAKELIENTPVKFSEIGYLVGIDDPYYFSRLFKKYTGMNPSQYKKNFSIVKE